MSLTTDPCDVAPATEPAWQATTRYSSIIPAAVLVILGTDGCPTFTRQKGGPFAGRWMLPGGGIEVGELAKEAAVREAVEETGIVVPIDDIRVIGTYEIIAAWQGLPRYHVLLSAFLAKGTYDLPAGFVGDNGGGTTQSLTEATPLHSSDRYILTDAGVLASQPGANEAALASDKLNISVLS
jgi:8-oxo-dGTP diphosphatase